MRCANRRIKGQGSHWLRDSTRWKIYARDGWACVYCQRGIADGVALSVDELVTRQRSAESDRAYAERVAKAGFVGRGGTAKENLITVCISCNASRQALTLRQFYRRLRDQEIDTAAIGRRLHRLRRKALPKKYDPALAALSKALGRAATAARSSK